MENQYINDSTYCTTNTVSVCVYCTSSWGGGGTWCSSGYFSCAGGSSSCQKCGNIRCYYNVPPYSLMSPPIPYVEVSEETVSVRPDSLLVSMARGILGYSVVVTNFNRIYNRIVRLVTRTLVPPRRTPDNQHAYGSISANVEMTFQDRNEYNNITAIVFKIKNCSWVFDRFLT